MDILVIHELERLEHLQLIWLISIIGIGTTDNSTPGYESDTGEKSGRFFLKM